MKLYESPVNQAEKPEPEKPSAPRVAEGLLNARTIIICEGIDQELAKKISAQLLVMASESDDDITMFINSQGGHVEAGDTIHDMIQYVRPKVKMIGTGFVASAGTHIFLAAEKEDRYCLPNTRFMIHQPSGGAGGSASDIEIQRDQIVKMRERLAQIITDKTGKAIEQVREDIERDTWLSTDEALEYGLINKVIKSASEIS